MQFVYVRLRGGIAIGVFSMYQVSKTKHHIHTFLMQTDQSAHFFRAEFDCFALQTF